jgi:hypothetical protein
MTEIRKFNPETDRILAQWHKEWENPPVEKEPSFWGENVSVWRWIWRIVQIPFIILNLFICIACWGEIIGKRNDARDKRKAEYLARELKKR